MRKATFLEYDKPLLCAVVQDRSPQEMNVTINNSLYDGAEAFCIQLEILKPEYRNEQTLKEIFSACRGLPIYITSYRKYFSEHLTDDDCAELLLLGAKCGATLCDVPGDFYCPEPHELTEDIAAIAKQKKLIERIHALGCEVLMSSHLHGFYDEKEVNRIALAQRERGADVVKIVNFATTEEEFLQNVQICTRLKRVLNCPYLYLASGEYGRFIRQTGGKLGCCMYLGVERYHTGSFVEQPILRSLKVIRDNMVF